MAAVNSTMLPLGTQAADFVLPDTISGDMLSLQGLRGANGTLILFICNHCPYVLHIRSQLIDLANDYRPRGVSMIAISSNDVNTHPQDGPEAMHTLMTVWGNPFDAYLYDETQQVARAYQAACTPDFYLFDVALSCVYRGRLDAATPSNDAPVDGRELRAALDAMLAGKPVVEPQLPSIGCNIKWKA